MYISWTATIAVHLLIAMMNAFATAPDSLDGWWVSEGYGTVLHIKEGKIESFQVTAISCLPDWRAKRLEKASEGAEAVLAQTPGGEKIFVRPGTSPDHKFFGFKWAASTVGFHRVPQRPAACDKPTENTPLSNFDIFWTTFHEHYPFFAMHGVNWEEVREKYRARITDKTTSQELFDVLKAMVEPLGDAHINLRGTGAKQVIHAMRPNSNVADDKTARRAKEIIETNYLHGKLRTWCNGRVGYGEVPDSIGYLRITAFAGYTDRPGFDSTIKVLDEALDQALQDSAKLLGLVIDVRINHGGSDVLGAAVASRFATKEYLAFAKKARNDPNDPNRFTALQDTMVPVSTRPHFHGKVVLLTGGTTISAGETFTMALMGRTPLVIRIGENTQGVFSDVLGRKLPNGFRFGLPNEIFVTKDGKSFDGPGVPPDVPCPVFPKDDLEKSRDGCLEKARELLLGKT
jgi:hypothetical protein